MKKMKLVIATPLYPPEIGGPATDAVSLEKYLPLHGITTAVHPFGPYRHLPKVIRHVAYGWRLFHRAREADGVVALDTVSVGLPSAVATRLACRPLIVRVPGDYAWEQGRQRFGVEDSIDDFQDRRYGFGVEALRLAQRLVVRGARLVVAPSDYFKTIVAGWGVSTDHLRRLYLGVETDGNIHMPQQAPEGKILFSAGRLVPWKGFAILVDIMKDLPIEWHLVIAGDGPQRTALERHARERGVASRILFIGSLPHADALGWMRRADAFALNTSFESFSFQIVEAMAAGVPVIATTAGNIPELITDGVEGVLCAPDDAGAFYEAVMSVGEEPEAWKRRTEAARRKAARFSVEASVAAFAAAVKDICA